MESLGTSERLVMLEIWAVTMPRMRLVVEAEFTNDLCFLVYTLPSRECNLRSEEFHDREFGGQAASV
jgi:hypothetical protein